jgi:glycosyltransferase involved in cell wall biosynthesis
VDEPVVSVITTVYDGERYLAESIESVLGQEGADLELVIVDDGSSDGTGRVLDAAVDPRVTVLRRAHRGRAAALNEAIAHSRGKYLAVHDADDRCLPGRVAIPVAVLEDRPVVDLVGSGQWIFIDEHGAELGRRPGPAVTDAQIRTLLRAQRAPFAHSSVTMRRAAVERVGGYDEGLLLHIDLDLYIRLAARGSLTTVPEALVATRRHPHQYFEGRRGPTRDLRRRLANRRVIDQRAGALDGPTTWTGHTPVVAREVASLAHWWARRLMGSRPVLPVAVRRWIDSRWSRRPGTD